MKHLFKSLLVILFCLPLLAAASNREDAKAMTLKAVAYVEQHGVDASRELFQTKDGAFYQDELYVFIIDFNGKTLIHGANPKLDGKVLLKLKDPKGNYFMKDMIEVVKADGGGWVNYMWKHPQTGKLTSKVTYVQKIAGIDGLVGCGVFE
tara:strand:- start:6910 stop:7359 length:450 start_codon:yes stop_codon:yes gene_type:complete